MSTGKRPSEALPGPPRASKMESCTTILNGFWPFCISRRGYAFKNGKLFIETALVNSSLERLVNVFK